MNWDKNMVFELLIFFLEINSGLPCPHPHYPNTTDNLFSHSKKSEHIFMNSRYFVYFFPLYHLILIVGSCRTPEANLPGLAQTSFKWSQVLIWYQITKWNDMLILIQEFWYTRVKVNVDFIDLLREVAKKVLF